MRLQSKCWLGIQASQGSTGERSISKFTYVIVGRIRFHVDYWTESLSSLLAVNWRPPLLPFPMGLSIRQFTAGQIASLEGVIEKSQRERERADKIEVTVFCNLSSEVTSHFFCHILFIRCQYVQPTLRGGNGTMAWISGDGDHCGLS